MKEILRDLWAGASKENVATLMQSLCDEAISAEQKAFALGAIMTRGVDEEFLAHAATYLLEAAAPLALGQAMDVCGTGGDGAAHQVKTFNISTAVAFVLAADGVPVVKHGNKAISSPSGSSDVLHALGVALCTTPDEARTVFDKENLCFVSAPHFHPVMKKLAALRKALGIPTFFNVLGPLINPARVKRQMIGVYDAALAKTVVGAAKILGKTDVMVVHAEDGLDEISLSSPSRIYHLTDGTMRTTTFHPEDLGLALVPLEAVGGGAPADNAKIIERVFKGEKGSPADIICLNAAAAFVVAGRDANMKQGFVRAREIIKSGAAKAKLQSMRSRT